MAKDLPEANVIKCSYFSEVKLRITDIKGSVVMEKLVQPSAKLKIKFQLKIWRTGFM